MIDYTVYTNEGEIVHTGVALQKEDISNLIVNGLNVIWEASTLNQYVNNGVIEYLPEKPNDNYTFNYQTRQWEVDLTKLDAKAKQKRDKLLAEGPDRINPMWWSSMTEQEQQAWTQYRQDLLDITGQADYPEFIVWPIKP